MHWQHSGLESMTLVSPGCLVLGQMGFHLGV